MNKLVEFHGKEQLPDAFETVAQNNPPDLVVVRDLVTDPDLLVQLGQYGKIEDEALEELYRQIPQFHEADAIIARRWGEIGYPEANTIGTMEIAELRRGGIRPHIDTPTDGAWALFDAIAQASLCLAGERRYGAEVLPESFKTPEGNFDAEHMAEFNNYYGAFRSSLQGGRKPRTQTDVYSGDLALFPNNPRLTLHSVEHKKGKRSIARLLTWLATEED